MHTQIGNYFAEKRLQAGKTQLEVANFLGVHPQYISNSERGIGSLSNAFIKKLLKFYDVNPNDFCDFSLKVHETYIRSELGLKKTN